MSGTLFLPKQILRATPLFAALNEASWTALSRSGARSYSLGETHFTEGEACLGLFVVVTGRGRIFKTSVNGREQVL